MLMTWKHDFEFPKHFVKSNAITENKIKSKKFVSPNRFECLKNYDQYEEKNQC